MWDYLLDAELVATQYREDVPVGVVDLSGVAGAVLSLSSVSLTAYDGGGGTWVIELPQVLSTAASPTFAGLTLTGSPLAVGSGGTGASTAAGARTALGLDDIATKKSNLAATAAPGSGNDNTQGYAVGSIWCDVTGVQAYICLNASTGAAVWKQVT